MSCQDLKLDRISEFEKLKYTAAEYLDNTPRGSQVSYIDVFGKNATDDEYRAWSYVAEGYSRYDFYHDNPYTYWRNLPQTQDEMDVVLERASHGDTYAMMQIAQILQESNRHEEAVSWYEAAADLGRSDALVRLGGVYKYGHGVQKDVARSIDYLEQAILLDGNDEALLDLGLYYGNGDGVPKDEKKSYDLMLRSARQGNSMARYNIGWMYHYGRGVESNIQEAVKWYELSAGGYYLKAFTNLTAIYHDSGYYDRMLSWTERYIDAGEPRAFLRMGGYLLEGCGVEKDVQKGLEYVQKAAEQNDPLAYYELGRLYGVGEAVETDPEKSFHYMSEAARLREPHAEFYVGKALWDSDREKALAMIQDAASQQYDLAIEFLKEKGLEAPMPVY